MGVTAAAFAPILGAPSSRGGINVSRTSLGVVLGLPTDTRGVVLACGSLALVLYGLAILLGGDLVGLAYLAGGLVSYLFLHARLVPTVVWALVAGAGLVAGLQSQAAGYVELAAGIALATVSVWPGSGRAAEAGLAGPTVTEAANASTSGLLDSAAVDVPETAPPAVAGVRIDTIGRFRVLVDGEDVTGILTRTSTLQFGWTFLLIRSLVDLDSLSRDDLGEELAPTARESVQLSRARKLLWAIANRLPAKVGALVDSDARTVSFRLDHCSVDLAELRRLTTEVAESDRIIPDDLAEKVQGFLESLPNGPFLPDVDRLIQYVNQGRGSAADNVRELRKELVGLRTELTCALADRATARGDHASTIRLLEPLLKETRREDLLDRLTNAYMRTGQTGRANELRRLVDAPQEV